MKFPLLYEIFDQPLKNVTFHAKNMRPLRLLADMFPIPFTNQVLETMVDTNDEWIRADRYRGKEDFKGEGLGSSDMAVGQ